MAGHGDLCCVRVCSVKFGSIRFGFNSGLYYLISAELLSVQFGSSIFAFVCFGSPRFGFVHLLNQVVRIIMRNDFITSVDDNFCTSSGGGEGERRKVEGNLRE